VNGSLGCSWGDDQGGPRTNTVLGVISGKREGQAGDLVNVDVKVNEGLNRGKWKGAGGKGASQGIADKS